MGETPFKLTYGVDAMIPVKVRESSPMVTFRSMSLESMKEEIDLSNEAKEMVHIREKALKQRIAKSYNSSMDPRTFEEMDLILWRANIGPPTSGQRKLAVNWEGPYKIIKVLGKGHISSQFIRILGSEIVE